MNANWYGDLFFSSDILNSFRNQGSSYDVEAGYPHALFDSQYDLRLKFAGYQFNTGTNVYGYKTGADLTSKNGMFMLRYEYGNDKLNGAYNNVGAFVNIGFQMENILKGESPVTMPEPIFKSPRNLNRMLTQTVKRDWNQQYAPGRTALAAASVGPGPGPTPGPTVCGTTTNQGILISQVSFTPNQLAEPYVKVSDLTSDGCATVTFTCAGPNGNNNLYIGVYLTGGGEYDFTPAAGVEFNGNAGTYSFTSVSGFQELLRSQDPWGNQYVEKIRLRIVRNYDGGSEATTTTNPVICFNRSCR